MFQFQNNTGIKGTNKQFIWIFRLVIEESRNKGCPEYVVLGKIRRQKWSFRIVTTVIPVLKKTKFLQWIRSLFLPTAFCFWNETLASQQISKIFWREVYKDRNWNKCWKSYKTRGGKKSNSKLILKNTFPKGYKLWRKELKYSLWMNINIFATNSRFSDSSVYAVRDIHQQLLFSPQCLIITGHHQHTLAVV